MSTSAAPFADRHIGPSAADVEHMLATLGLSSLDELIDQAVGLHPHDGKPLELEGAISEPEAIARLGPWPTATRWSPRSSAPATTAPTRPA